MNQKGFASMVLISLVVILAVVAGYFVLVKKQEPVTRQVPTPSSTTEQDETNNWQVYRSEEFKYEIKYPSDWKVTEHSGIRKDGHFNVSITVEPSRNPSPFKPSDSQKDYSALSVNAQDSSSGEKLEQIANGEKVEINGIAAVRSGPSPIPFESEVAFRFYENSLRSSLTALNGNVIYSLIGESYGPNFQSNDKLINEIISTFRILR